MRYMVRFLVCAVVMVVVALPAAAAQAAGTVNGSVTANGQKVPLVRVYVDESSQDVIVVLASKDIPHDILPFIGEEVARKQKLYAVVFTVSRADRALARGFGGVFYPGEDMGFVGLGEGAATLEVKRLDATGIEGRVVTPKPVELGGLTYTFDVTFSAPLGTAAPPAPVVEAKVSGDTSPPAKAYADYYRAIFAGDLETIGASFAAPRRKDFDAADPEERKMLLELMTINPSEIRIHPPVVKGTTATLTIEGLNESSGETTATITMVQEGGAWKVAGEKWSTK